MSSSPKYRTGSRTRKVQGQDLRVVSLDIANDFAAENDVVNADVALIVTRSQKLTAGRNPQSADARDLIEVI